MSERRESFRHLVNLNVGLYHDAIGRIDGSIHDVSSGGMSIRLSKKATLNSKLQNEVVLVKPSNMDVLFNMKCLRVDGTVISLKFKE